MNRKKVYRLWVELGLRVPRKRRRRKHEGRRGENACHIRRAEYVDHVWTYDFAHDTTSDGRTLRWFSVIDECSRVDLALEVERRFPGASVIEVLDRLFSEHGVPAFIRSDHGPEFISKAVRKWLADRGVGTIFVAPGSPWENGYVESFHATLRDELLEREEFGNVLEARLLAAGFRDEYNHVRPHGSLGGQTPMEFRTRAKTGFAGSPRSNDREVPRHLRTPEINTVPS